MVLGYVCVPSDVKEKVIQDRIAAAKAGDGNAAVIWNAAPAWAALIFTGGLLALMYIYAMANFAKQIAYCMIIMFNVLYIGILGALLASTTDPQISEKDKQNLYGGAAGVAFVLILHDFLIWC